jgi:hypothetical protein
MCSRARQVSLLKIREKELQFYTQNCIAIGTQAALLSGFAYNGIIQVDIPEESSDVLKALYLCVTTAAMGFELIAVLNSTLCSMLGPGLALRGPDGSMHRAVDGLMLEYRLTFVFFTMGLVAFHISALLFAWLEFSRSAGGKCRPPRWCRSSPPRPRGADSPGVWLRCALEASRCAAQGPVRGCGTAVRPRPNPVALHTRQSGSSRWPWLYLLWLRLLSQAGPLRWP